MVSYITQGNGPILAATNIAALVVSWLFASVRIYVRLFIVRLWKIEDWLYVAALGTFSVLSIISLEATIHGNGQRLTEILPDDLVVAMKLWFLGEIFYVCSVLLLRLSIGFLLLRICTQKMYVYSIWATIVVMAITSIAYFFFLIFQCAPVEFFWLQFSGLSGKCLSPETIENVTVAHSTVCAAADIIFGVLPIMLISTLQLNLRQKISASILLSLGIIAGITVIIRIEYVKEVDLSEDFLYATSKVSIWSEVEPTIGLVCAAAATFRPLFKSLLGVSTRRYGSNGQSAQPKDVEKSGAISLPDVRQPHPVRAGRIPTCFSSVVGANKNGNSDFTPLESAATTSQQRVASPSESETDMLDKRIYFTTTVDITRHPKGEESD